MFFCDFLGPPDQVKLETVVAGGVEHIHQRHFSAKQGRGPFYVRGHSNASGREIHWKKDICDQPHSVSSELLLEVNDTSAVQAAGDDVCRASARHPPIPPSAGSAP